MDTKIQNQNNLLDDLEKNYYKFRVNTKIKIFLEVLKKLKI